MMEKYIYKNVIQRAKCALPRLFLYIFFFKIKKPRDAALRESALRVAAVGAGMAIKGVRDRSRSIIWGTNISLLLSVMSSPEAVQRADRCVYVCVYTPRASER
jgi:hypothetical protein